VAGQPRVEPAVISASMLLRCGGSRQVRFVFCRHGCLEALAQVGQLAAVGDWSAVPAQEHRPAASGAAWLARDRRRAHFGAGFTDSLPGGNRDRPHALAATDPYANFVSTTIKRPFTVPHPKKRRFCR